MGDKFLIFISCLGLAVFLFLMFAAFTITVEWLHLHWLHKGAL